MIIQFWTLCSILIVLPALAQASFSSNDKRLERIEPLLNIKYEIAPRTRHFFVKRHQSSSVVEPKKIEYDDQLRLTLYAYNTTFHLHLEPNHDLFHPNAVVHQDGTSERLASHQVYKGYVVHSDHSDTRWIKEQVGVVSTDNNNLGWARILVRNDLMHSNQPIIEGAFQYFGDLYHIKATTNYHLVRRDYDPSLHTAEMIIYRESDTSSPISKRQQEQHECGFDTLNQPLIKTRSLFMGGNNLLLKKRYQDGCPTTKKINYMGAAADCTYVQHYKSRDAARIQIINDFNMASAIFEETFNIALGLINITIMDPTCPTTYGKNKAWNRVCDADYSLGDRLSDFSQWRATMSNDGAGLWHLMTNCPTGVEVGLAWLKQLCNTKATVQTSSKGTPQYVTGAGVSAITRDEWKVVAHEIGHSFGAIHDCNSNSCPCVGDNCDCCPLSASTCDTGGSYLMTPISNASAENFSPCSVNTICSAFPSVGHCLSNPQDRVRSIYQLNVCGNGIKEEGEECDTSGEDTDCCDATTCKLKQPAVCEDQNETCCHKCQIQPKTHMCRPAATPCDIAEYCTGDSPSCPSDLYIPDGVSCGSDGLSCASGQCTSRDEQCLSRGFVMNITQSCRTNNEECKMLCNKAGDSNKCLQFSGNFIDGTPCGQGGHCLSGICKNGVKDSTLKWMKEHLNIVIPVCIIAFLFVCGSGFLLFWFGCCCFAGYKEKKNNKEAIGNKLFTRTDSAKELPKYDVPTANLGMTKSSSQHDNSKAKKNFVTSFVATTTAPSPFTANSSSSSITVVGEEDEKK